MLKQLSRNPILQIAIGRIMGAYMLLAGWTTRWRDVNRASAERIWASKQGLVLLVWHNRFMLAHTLWNFKAKKAFFLTSRSREGDITTRAAMTVGAPAVRGSTDKAGKSKGGREALREMKRVIDGGAAMGMTPDGPKGPRMRIGLGPVQLARMTGAPMFAYAWSTRRRITLNTWDRFIIPLPFTSGVRIWGEPIFVPRDLDEAGLEAARLAIENELNRVTMEADRLSGAEVIEPAPAEIEAPAPNSAAPEIATQTRAAS